MSQPTRRGCIQRIAAGVSALAVPALGRPAEAAVKVGLTLPLTAAGATSGAISTTDIVPDLGLEYLAGFNAAIDIERRGMAIEAVPLDDMLNPETARANVEALDRQGVVALSGLWSTAVARAALPVVERAGLPVVGLRTGAAELRNGRHPMLFHLRPGYDDEVATLVDVMGGAGFTQFGVLRADDEFGTSCLALLRAHPRVRVLRAESVGGSHAQAAPMARDLVSTPGVQALLLLAPVDVLAPVMTELRIRQNPFLAPVSALSHVLCDKLAVARDPVYRAFAVTCPYPNPLVWRADIAVRFRDAMADRGLDHADRSYSGFEGFVAGTLITRALLSVRGTPTRDALARALRARPHDLRGLRIAFNNRQVGHRQVSFLYKSQVDGAFRA